ncbi:MAG: helix-turn-helix transcriptional regulator [Gemmatimonadota bacterium]
MAENLFGNLVAARRQDLRLTLRKFAALAEMDAGNLSRIERGVAAPPQAEEVLARMADALALALGTPERERFVDLAVTANGRIPTDLMADDEVMASLPLLFRTLRGAPLTEEKLERLVDAIRTS